MQEKLYIHPAQHPDQAHKSNLPVQLTPLIGRGQEVSVVCALPRPNRLYSRMVRLEAHG